MTTLPNDDFDMCCGSRPHITRTWYGMGWIYNATCCLCGDRKEQKGNLSTLMIEWNKWQRSKA